MYYCALTEFFDSPRFLPENERNSGAGAAMPQSSVFALRSRAARRLILGGICGMPPAKLVFETGPHGKPLLRGGPHFSVSHCGDRFVIAVCAVAAVGVDVENPARNADFDSLSRRIMCPAEREDFARLDAAGRRAFFMRIWTAKEAALKAAGTGLGGAPVFFDVRGYGPVAVAGGQYWLSRLSLPDGFEGAVCAAGGAAREIVFAPLDAADFSGRSGSPA